MSRSPSSRPPSKRRPPIALIAAWLLVFGLCAAAGAFVYLEQQSEGPRTGGGLTLILPPAADPVQQAPAAAIVAEAQPAGTAETAAPSAAREPATATEAEPSRAPEAQSSAASQSGTRAADEAAQQPVQEAGEGQAQQQSAAAAGGTQVATGSRKPRIAVVVTGLGLSKAVSEMAIARLPAEITLSFSPYASDLDQWLARARSRGHEVLIDLPMEPASFPEDDPGPKALLTGLAAAENLERLRWILGRGRGYLGVAAVMGSRFTASEAALQPILQELKSRGMLYLDNRSTEQSVAGRLATSLALPHAISDRALDDGEPDREAIRARLAQVERLALARGASVTMGRSLPVTLERLADWAAGLEARGLALAPISALTAAGSG